MQSLRSISQRLAFKTSIRTVALLPILLLASCGESGTQPPGPPRAEVSVVTLHPQSVVITTELPGRTTASLTGYVTDTDGGAIPGANVEVKNNATGIAMTVASRSMANTPRSTGRLPMKRQLDQIAPRLGRVDPLWLEPPSDGLPWVGLPWVGSPWIADSLWGRIDGSRATPYNAATKVSVSIK